MKTKTTKTKTKPAAVVVPRETTKGKNNPLITILCDNLCLALFDADEAGHPHHLHDITAHVFPQLRQSYPEIKTTQQALVYVLWSMKQICWNNRAKLVEKDWFENPYTATEAINDSLPEGSPWEARVPSRFGEKDTEQKRTWKLELDKAKLAVKHLRGWFPTWDNQKIIDLLYNPDNGTKYALLSVETAIRELASAI
jgi:hypothetical protein